MSQYNRGYASSLKCKSVVGYSAIKITSHLQRPKIFFCCLTKFKSVILSSVSKKKNLKSQKTGLWVLSGLVISRCGANCVRTFKSKNPSYDFGRNKSTLSEFIGCADSTDFHETSSKHSRDNDKPKCVGKFWYLTYFSCGIHLRNTSRTFFATPT